MIEGTLVGGLVLVLIALGALPTKIFSIEPGWFWADWLVRLWLDSPADLALPAASFCVVAIFLNIFFERFDIGPGAWLLKLRVVDAHGRPASWPQLFLRAFGVLLSFATAGFGFLWMFISRHHRTLSDLISGTCVVRD